jgi:hypothetical protein
MANLSPKQKLAWYKSRRRKGDNDELSFRTGYSVSHVSNVVAGRRTAPEDLANEMYNISRRRSIQMN